MRQVVLKMLPEDEKKYEEQLHYADERQVALAQFLQRMALPQKEHPAGFQPAPIYLQQAISITTSFAHEIELERLMRGRFKP